LKIIVTMRMADRRWLQAGANCNSEGKPMLRVPFTAEDLLRTRFAAEPAPLLELSLAVSVLQRHDALFERWRRRGRAALPRAAGPMLQLIPSSGTGPLFLDPVSEGVEDGLDTVLSTPQPVVERELDRVFASGGASPFVKALRGRDRHAWGCLDTAIRVSYRALLSEQWPRVQAGFRAEVSLRASLFAEQGVRAVLTSIYPGTSWDGSVLQIPVESRLRLDLRGRGVILMPSVMWRGRPLFTHDPGGSLMIVYAAATPLPLVTGDLGGSSLAALIGTTRATMLALAATRPTTTELARQAEVSAASASGHTKVLRECGLITTRRDGKAVRHALTGLGEQLLNGGGGWEITVA
jgi:DNA-binding transcriptional ArsR family regulator